MKILEPNAGVLTNFEVLNFLRSRGARKDPTRIIVSVAPSEFKVYDYLEQTAASNQTKDVISEFLEKSKQYNLAKAEIVNIINMRPSSLVEIDPIIEEPEKRYGERLEDLVEMVVQVLPPSPTQMETGDETGGDGEDAKEDGKE